MNIFDFILRKLKEGHAAVLATVVSSRGSAPAAPGKKMAFASDGATAGTVGGGALEARVIDEAGEILEEKKSRLLHFKLDDTDASDLGMICGGEQDVFLDFISSRRRLVIFGGGHVGLALARVAAAIDFPVLIVDDRSEFIDPDRFPPLTELVNLSFEEDDWTSLAIDTDTYLVIITRGHRFDRICLERALVTSAPYIGMIGSRSKVDGTIAALEKKGLTIRQDPRIYSPIGLDLGDKSPQEIAISIMAEIIKVKSGGTGLHMRERK